MVHPSSHPFLKAEDSNTGDSGTAMTTMPNNDEVIGIEEAGSYVQKDVDEEVQGLIQDILAHYAVLSSFEDLDPSPKVSAAFEGLVDICVKVPRSEVTDKVRHLAVPCIVEVDRSRNCHVRKCAANVPLASRSCHTHRWSTSCPA